MESTVEPAPGLEGGGTSTSGGGPPCSRVEGGGTPASGDVSVPPLLDRSCSDCGGRGGGPGGGGASRYTARPFRRVLSETW